MKTTYKNKTFNSLFLINSLIFHISIGALFIAIKFEKQFAIEILDIFSTFTIIPFSLLFIINLISKVKKKIIIAYIFILLYLAFKILFDFILENPFRETLYLLIINIALLFIASLSIISIGFSLNNKIGYIISALFTWLLACLIYLFIN